MLKRDQHEEIVIETEENPSFRCILNLKAIQYIDDKDRHFTCLFEEREAHWIPIVSIFHSRIENKPQALKFQRLSLTLCPT